MDIHVDNRVVSCPWNTILHADYWIRRTIDSRGCSLPGVSHIRFASFGDLKVLTRPFFRSCFRNFWGIFGITLSEDNRRRIGFQQDPWHLQEMIVVYHQLDPNPELTVFPIAWDGPTTLHFWVMENHGDIIRRSASISFEQKVLVPIIPYKLAKSTQCFTACSPPPEKFEYVNHGIIN